MCSDLQKQLNLSALISLDVLKRMSEGLDGESSASYLFNPLFCFLILLVCFMSFIVFFYV